MVGVSVKWSKGEEWEDAVRAFEAAFEASGRSSQEVCHEPGRISGVMCSLVHLDPAAATKSPAAAQTIEGQGLL